MIQVRVLLSDEKVISSFVVEGHSGFALKGNDIVCAAVTVLVRTFLNLVRTDSDVQGVMTDQNEGRVSWLAEGVEEPSRLLYEGWSWFIMRGLEDLVREFPDHINLQYGRHTGRMFHGS